MVKISSKNKSLRQQIELFSYPSLKHSFGGSHKKGNPKGARPFSSKHLIHVVLKSEKAFGAQSFLRIERKIVELAKDLGARVGVNIKDMVVMGNHIHLSIKCLKRRSLANFLRAFAGILVRKILGAEKGRVARLQDFFSGRPFSRIVAGGRKCFFILKNYFELNRLEKLGYCKEAGRNQLKIFAVLRGS